MNDGTKGLMSNMQISSWHPREDLFNGFLLHMK